MPKRPLEGLRVADFSWFGAGPIAGNTFSQFGAEVIRVESEAKLDGLRVGAPTPLNPDGTPKSGYNMSGYFNNFNTGKLSLQLNLNTEKGQELGYRLIEKSDFFLTNFTPRVIDKWNLRYDQISKVNPRIIAAYAPMQGLEGPHRDFLGFGAVLTPVTGISEMSGFPNRPPFGIGTNYPDYVINPGHTVTAMLAALRHRNRTGKGQCVELPQIESVVNTLGTAVAERLINGTNPSRTGNRSPGAAPHGAFRCADDPESVNSPDRWVAIACRSDAEWAAVASVLGHAEMANDPKFATLAARKQHEGELEALVGSWTAGEPAMVVTEKLQAAGVPAGIVQNAQDLLDRDVHVRARGYYQYVDHPDAGREAHDGPAAMLSATPGSVPGPAPLLGEHTLDVCERIIGLNMDEVADLLADGVLL
ncbi:MAG: CoA transferase [bacterium]